MNSSGNTLSNDKDVWCTNNLIDDMNLVTKNIHCVFPGKLFNSINEISSTNGNDNSLMTERTHKATKNILNPQNSMYFDRNFILEHQPECLMRSMSNRLTPKHVAVKNGNEEFMRECIKTVNAKTEFGNVISDKKNSTVLDIYVKVKKSEFIFKKNIAKSLREAEENTAKTPKFRSKKESDDKIVTEYQIKNQYKMNRESSSGSLIDSDHVNRHQKINMQVDFTTSNNTGRSRTNIRNTTSQKIKLVLDTEKSIGNYSSKIRVTDINGSNKSLFKKNFTNFCNLQLKELFYCCNNFTKKSI